jgi:hypothetical protein
MIQLANGRQFANEGEVQAYVNGLKDATAIAVKVNQQNFHDDLEKEVKGLVAAVKIFSPTPEPSLPSEG